MRELTFEETKWVSGAGGDSGREDDRGEAGTNHKKRKTNRYDDEGRTRDTELLPIG